MAEQMEYYTAMDIVAQQYEDTTKLYYFYTALREENKLVTTKCKACGHVPWPPRTLCPECISTDYEWVEMPKVGTIVSWTAAYAGMPPELAARAPIVYALIDFENGLRMPTAILELDPAECKTGMEVELIVGDVQPDQQGRRRVAPYFKPVGR
jgi:uncharacterized OB-fold protein